MKTSNFLSLDWRDLVKGFLMSILTPALVLIQQSLEAGVLVVDWRALGLSAIAGGVAYLAKNFFTQAKQVSLFDSGLPKPRDPKV
jgi:hypothetical protein